MSEHPSEPKAAAQPPEPPQAQAAPPALAEPPQPNEPPQDAASPQGGGKGKRRMKSAEDWLKNRSVAALGAAGVATAAAIGTLLATTVWSGAGHAAKAVGKDIVGSSASAPSLPPLGVTADVSYSDTGGIALASPVDRGVGYADILTGLSDVGPGPTWGAFLAQYYGAPVGELHMDLVLTGQAAGLVRVTDVSVVRVGAPVAPLSGTLVPIVHQGGQSAYQFSVNMDSPDPALQRLPSGQTFPDFNVQLAPGEQVTLAIDFKARRYTSKWTLDIDYLVGTTVHVLTIHAPNGQPFAVTGMANSYKVTYVSNFPQLGYHIAG